MRNRSVEAVAGISINPIRRNLTASQKEFVTGRRPLAPPLRRDVPLWTGGIAYFADAVIGVAKGSGAGRRQHGFTGKLRCERSMSTDARPHGPARGPAAPRERSAYGEVLARRGGCHLQRPLTGRRRRGSVRLCDGSPQRATSRPTAPVASPWNGHKGG
jgi:hypothetical protein